MFKTFRLLFEASAKSKAPKYKLYKGYVIPIKPINNYSGGYSNFTKQNFFKYHKQTNDHHLTFKVLSQNWKKLSQQQQQKYKKTIDHTNVIKQQQEQYKKQFIEPIDSIKMKPHNYYKTISPQRYKSVVFLGQQYMNLSKHQKQQYKKQLQQYKKGFSQRLQQLQQNKIPVIPFKTFQQYYKIKFVKLNPKLPVKQWYHRLNRLSNEVRNQQLKQYLQQLSKFKKRVYQFCQRFQLKKEQRQIIFAQNQFQFSQKSKDNTSNTK